MCIPIILCKCLTNYFASTGNMLSVLVLAMFQDPIRSGGGCLLGSTSSWNLWVGIWLLPMKTYVIFLLGCPTKDVGLCTKSNLVRYVSLICFVFHKIPGGWGESFVEMTILNAINDNKTVFIMLASSNKVENICEAIWWRRKLCMWVGEEKTENRGNMGVFILKETWGTHP